MNENALVGLAGVVGLAVAAAAVALWPDDWTGYTAPGLARLTPPQVMEAGAALASSLLTEVYGAFEETGEDAVYDGLAQVSAGPALEALYLERVGAMAGGGLDRSDQQVHEMDVVRLDATRDGSTIRMDATWRVIGSVTHATHVHVRGNAYSAILTVEPVEGAWRITEFDLRDVDRTDAGGLVAAVP